jgi:glycine cleavage system H protein
VVEVNKAAVAEPGIVNDDPYGDGWLIKVKLSTDEEAGKLMTAERYAEYLREEEKEK